MAGKRSRDGCWNCRQKRRKCDEAKPFCDNCTSKGITCGGYELHLAEFRQGHNGQMVGKLMKGPAASASSPTPKRSHKRAQRSDKARVFDLAEERLVTPGRNTSDSEVSRLAPPDTLRDSRKEAPDACIMIEDGSPIYPVLDKSITNDLNALHAHLDFSSTAMDLISSNLSSEEENICDQGNTDVSEGLSLLNDPSLDTSIDTFYSSDSLYRCTHDDGSVPYPSLGGSMDISGTLEDVTLVPSEHDAGIDWFFAGVGEIHPDFLHYKEKEGGARKSEDEKENQREEEGEGAEIFPWQDPQRFESSIEAEERLFENSRSSLAAEKPGSPSSASSVFFDRHFNHSDISSPFDSFLYSHFFNVLAPCFHPTELDHNPYKMIYGKIASSFQPLRSAILGASALHLSCMGQLPAAVVSLYRDSLQVSLSKAVSALKRADDLAATLLLSIVLEFVGNGSDIWTSKLCRVRALLTRKPSDSSELCDSPVTQFLRLHFNWITAIGRTMQEKQLIYPSIDQLEFIDDGDVGEHAFPMAQERWFSNLPDYECFLLLKEATALSRTALDNDTLGVDGARRLIPDVADLLLRVRQWQPKSSDAFATCTAQALRVQKVWREGLLCYIYADVCALPTSDHRIQECVRRAMEAMGDLTWIQLVMWPAFLVSVHASTVSDREICQKSFSSMAETMHIAGPITISRFLQRVWADMDRNGTGDSRWRTIMSKSGIQMNLVM